MGLTHYALGNATLSLEGENLAISNMSASGDRVMIKSENVNTFELTAQSPDMTEAQAVSLTLYGIDDYNRIKVLGQMAINCQKISLNTRLLGPTYTLLIGMKNGIEVYNQTHNNPGTTPLNNWAVLLVGAAVWAINKVSYEKKTERDADGNITSTETTWDWGTGLVIYQDPWGEQEFEADHIYLKSEIGFPEPLPPQLDNKTSHLEVMFVNYPDFVINNEIYE